MLRFMMSHLNTLWPYAVGLIFGVLVGHFGIARVVDSMWQSIGWEKGTSGAYEVRPDAWMAKIVGFVERTLYVVATIMGVLEFVAVWLALKVAGQWKRWEEQDPHTGVVGRSVYNTFLVGSAVSIAYGITGGKLVTWLASEAWLPALAVPISLVVMNVILILVIRSYRNVA